MDFRRQISIWYCITKNWYNQVALLVSIFLPGMHFKINKNWYEKRRRYSVTLISSTKLPRYILWFFYVWPFFWKNWPSFELHRSQFSNTSRPILLSFKIKDCAPHELKIALDSILKIWNTKMIERPINWKFEETSWKDSKSFQEPNFQSSRPTGQHLIYDSMIMKKRGGEENLRFEFQNNLC